MKAKKISRLLVAGLCLPIAADCKAQTVWDGGGGNDTWWGTTANWDNDTLPAFNGTDSLTVTAASAGNTAMTLGADRSIGRLTFGGGAAALSLSGNTLQLNSTTTTAGTGAALWNAATSDNITAVINTNVLLSSGAAGSYTGHFRENSNSNGGTRFNGTVTQGAGELWTLRFSRASARGQFFFNNGSNSIAALRTDGADIWSETPGAFGGAAITLATGLAGTRLAEHFTSPVANDITLAGASSWVSAISSRLTGNLNQGGQTLTYGSSTAGSNVTRLEYASVTGTGTTSLAAGAVALGGMSQLTTGGLDIGISTGSMATMVLSGAAGNDVPTWADFSAARNFLQTGGAGTWRLNAGTAGANSPPFGGFAARGADLVIPATGGGLTSATFARNFVLGSSATVGGVRYADNAVIVQTDIDYGAAAGANRYFAAAPNAGTGKAGNVLTLAGPVHELAGKITGDNVIVYPMGQSNVNHGIVRISNPANSLTGNSRWILGGQRAAFTSVGGGTIPAASNMGDNSSMVLIFTSDGAFGGAAEVQVSSQGSSGTAPSSTLLFEDVNPGGPTTFTRNLNVLNTSQTNGAAAWGSYGGDAIYTGTVRLEGTQANSMIHVQSGMLTLGLSSPATITNNRTVATTHDKSGAGILALYNLQVNGTQTTNNWNVRAGELLVWSIPLTGNVTVSNGATFSGKTSVTGTLTAQTGSTLSPGIGPSGTVSGNIGSISVSSQMTLAAGSKLAIQIHDWNAGANSADIFGPNSLNITATAANPVVVQLSPLDLINFTEASRPFVLVNSFVPVTGFSANKFQFNPTGFPGAGTWSVELSPDSMQVLLLYTAPSGQTPYEAWIAGFPSLTLPGDRAPDADPDKDGVSNLAEFALSGDPANSGVRGMAVGVLADPDGAGPEAKALLLSLPVRTGAAFAAEGGDLVSVIDGVRYRIECSADLATWALSVGEVTPNASFVAGLPALPAGWNWRTFRAPGDVASAARRFLRAGVSLP